MKQYQSREYCKDINCIVQNGIESNMEGVGIYCQKCEAYKFHQWLKDNGYKISKEE